MSKSLSPYPKYLVGVHILTHQHTSVILRRFFFHFGTVYLYRVVTISVTILPVPKLPNGHCMPPTDGSLQQIFARSFGQLVGGGMDMTGNNMCGLVIFFILYTQHSFLFKVCSLKLCSETTCIRVILAWSLRQHYLFLNTRPKGGGFTIISSKLLPSLAFYVFWWHMR